MFTGLIEEIGSIKLIQPIKGGKKLFISCNEILSDLKVDDSVAINGVCLTAVKVEGDGFWADAVGETLTKSTLNSYSIGSRINLERALRLSDRLGGHIVQGHVNGIGKVSKIFTRGDNFLFSFTLPSDLQKYVVSEGSIAVNGISLTIAALEGTEFSISVIPHTYRSTTLKDLSVGNDVNIEVDILAKYIEKMTAPKDSKSKLSEDWLKEMGY